MHRRLLMTSFAMLALAAGVAHAKDGYIIKGLNGTKWCCPGGKVGDGCEKGANSTPVGARCNFASVQAGPGSTGDIRAAGVVRPVPVPVAARLEGAGPKGNPPAERKWASPAERCHSQDNTKQGWVSVGEGGRRCEYDIAKPRSSEPSARD